MNRTLASAFVLTCGAAASMSMVACGSSEMPATPLSLLDGNGSQPSTNPESERLRRLQMLRYISIISGNREVIENTPEGFAGSTLQGACRHEVQLAQSACNYNGPNPLPTPSCARAACDALVSQCEAHILNEAASLRAKNVSIINPESPVGSNSFEIPPQSTPTQAAAYRVAASYAQNATYRAMKILTGQGGCSFSNLSDALGTSGKIGAQMATLLTDSYHLFDESMAHAVDTTIAAADAQFAATPSLSEAERMAISADALSRSAAAHLLVGGSPGLSDFPDGFCPGPYLTAPAQAAIKLFRTSGMRPAALLGQTQEGEVRLLVEGPLGEGSIRERLENLWGVSIGTTETALEDYAGLTIADFKEARKYLEDELFAFGRSMDAPLGPIPGPGGFTKYAGIASRPQIPGASYYSQRAKVGWDGYSTAPSNFTHPYDGSTLPGSPDAAPIVAQYVDAVGYEGNFASVLLKDVLTDADLNKQVQTQLALLLSTASARRPGRLVLDLSSDGTLIATAWGYAPTDGLKLVAGSVLTGADRLRCATTGTVEGAACTITTAGSLDLSNSAPAASTTFDFHVGAQGTLSAAQWPFFGQWIYLVKPRAGISAASARPGDYEALTGAVLPALPPSGSHALMMIPVVPDAERKVGEALAPSPSSCKHSHVTCAEAVFDERLPLEDELSQDNDGVESSWKHYLALAKQAAAESDLLGSGVLQSGIEYDKQLADADQIKTQMDLRAEDELERLQEICGTALDSHQLLEILSGGNSNGDLSNVMGSTSVTSCPQTACPPGWKCTQGTNPGSGSAGICIPDFAALAREHGDAPDMNRLAECLENTEVVDFVTLGDKPLCVWVDPSDSNKVCESASPLAPLFPCPAFRKGSQCAASDFGFDAAQIAPFGTIKDVSETLGFFSSGETAASRGDQNPCRLIRRLRKHPEDADALAELKASNALHPDVLIGGLTQPSNFSTEPYGRITWEQRYRGFSAILMDGLPLFETGSSWKGPANATSGWPCGSAQFRSDCNSESDGLFCSHYDCANKTTRAEANDRMLRAVLGTQYLGIPTIVVFGWKLGYATSGSGTVKSLVLDPTATPPTTFPIRVLGPQEDPNLQTHGFVTGGLMATYVISGATGDADYFFQTPQSGTATGSATVSPYAALHFPGCNNGISFYPLGAGPEYPLSIKLRGLSSVNTPASATTAQGVAVPLSPSVFEYLTRGTVPPAGISTPSWCPLEEELFGYNVLSIGPPAVALSDADLVANPGSLLRYQCDPRSQLDALELMCELARGIDPTETAAQGCGQFPTISTTGDLGKANAYLQCIAGQIERKSALSVLTHVPKQAADLMKQVAGVGSYPSVGGEYGTAVATLRGALVEISTAGPAIAGELRGLGSDLSQLRTKLQINGIQSEIADVKFMAGRSAQIARCQAAVASGVGQTFGGAASLNPGQFIGGMGNVFAAAVECGDATAQIHFSEKLRDLEKQQAGLQNNLDLAGFSDRFSTHATALQTLGLKVQEQVELANAQLSTIEGLRSGALRSLSRAMYLSSLQSKTLAGVSASMLARFSLDKVRYKRAFKNAQKMAFTAKRAIEQRLGKRLIEMTDPLPLVDAAPSTWESTVCSTSGVDYDALKDADPNDTENLKNFADGFIGDYVTKLENVIESYRMTKSFHEGTDTAVLSLRDDVLNIRTGRDCTVPVANLLFESANLDRVSTSSSHGWTKVGCTETTPGVLQQNCINATPLNDDVDGQAPDNDTPFPAGTSLSNVTGYRLQFADATPTCTNSPCGFLKDSALVQRVTLNAGKYRLSWYARGQGANDVVAAVRCSPPAPDDAAACPNPSEVARTAPRTPTTPAPTNWMRYFYDFTLTSSTPESIEIAMRHPTWGRGIAATMVPPRLAGVDVAAVMLENITTSEVTTGDAAGTPAPREFVSTGQALTMPAKLCEDSNGSEFRVSGFHRGCMKLCPDGFANSCDGSRAKTFCYRETQFNINQRDIESGKILTQSGLALGNFNYRIESVGVNFVGSGIRDCSQSTLPSTCYSSGNVPYSIEHWGPYFVRNYEGQDFEAKLFTGHIEHARGLAAERYLTNPLSSDDTSLIEQYLRTELQGRPLDGNFVLRVWDDDSVNFNAIQDIQVVLKYRYWTRFN